MGPFLEPYWPALIFQKTISDMFEELYIWNWILKEFNLRYIIWTYFHTELSMFGLDFSATEEWAEGPYKGTKGPGGQKGPPSPPKELEEEAQSTPNF